jgi:formylglycine-generating enzyme required for sulfatase activity
MPSKIFVNYRRDDDPNGAARVRDGLVAKFGKSSVFMDVDNLLAGQRFDEELAKALSQCDVLIAVMGPRWMELSKARTASGERDYVREEIAEALARKLTVIPVRVGRDGHLLALPRRDDLPEDIRDLVLYQKHDVTHERFSRDIAELNDAITIVRRTNRRPNAAKRVLWGWAGGIAVSLLAIGVVGAYYSKVLWPSPSFTWSQTSGSQSPLSQAQTKAKIAQLLLGVRERYPEYRSTSDEELIDAVYRRFYSDLSRSDFERRLLSKIGNEIEFLADLKSDEDRKRVEADAKRTAVKENIPKPGQTFRDCNDGCPEMVVVPAGSYTMGLPASEPGRDGSEAPQRQVSIRQAFAVGRFEVTFAEWEACVAGGGCQSNRTPSDQTWGKGRRPVINVSWNDAKEYVAWLSQKTGRSYRLLSEAEWEYAARAGTTTSYFWGNDIGRGRANCDGCRPQAEKQTEPVGSFTANAFGLHDVHGNVWELVEDCWNANYQGAPQDGSAWSKGDCRRHVIRGGSWYTGPQWIRSAKRESDPAGYKNSNVGFRVARGL